MDRSSPKHPDDADDRRLFFEQLARRWDEIRADEAEWQQIVAERAVEAGAIRDNLDL
jgi:hypothetical protein